MFDLDAIRARLPRWGNDDYLALIGEVERLRTAAFHAEGRADEAYRRGWVDGQDAERAAVAGWLRTPPVGGSGEPSPGAAVLAVVLQTLAEAVESGEHREGSKP